ncbi:ribose-phosphate diphosphokinase [Caldivirga sp. UBA161]|uniref:ribose-phosphate diphosphokinase n=1 Tax=Caldivirga sp. UBA161 TaxID=1915569 RepID=UPI0025BD3A40|nr:ribose-phosphate diphosphokinase [Caldivirga sp. UBA161]
MRRIILYDESSRDLGPNVASRIGAEAREVTHKVFPDGEQYVRVEANVRGNDVLYVTRLYPNQDQGLIRVMLLLDAVKGLGASRVGLFIPYMPYARQDRRFLEGEPVSINVMLNVLKGLGVDYLYVVDIHKPQSLEGYPGFINLKPFELYARGLGGLSKPVVVSPDLGSLWRAEELAKVLDAEYDYLEKHRDRYSGEVSFTLRNLNVKGRDVVIIDDIISTGGTIIGAAGMLRNMGATSINVVATHCIMIGGAEAKLTKVVDKLYCSNSILGKYSQFDVAQLITK